MILINHIKASRSDGFIFYKNYLYECLSHALCVTRATLCDPHRQQPARLHCPWDSPGKNTGVGCHFLLQGSNLGLPHCGQIFYHLSHQGSHALHRDKTASFSFTVLTTYTHSLKLTVCFACCLFYPFFQQRDFL